MKKFQRKIIALCLALCLLLSGCSYIGDYFSMLGSGFAVWPLRHLHPDAPNIFSAKRRNIIIHRIAYIVYLVASINIRNVDNHVAAFL